MNTMHAYSDFFLGASNGKPGLVFPLPLPDSSETLRSSLNLLNRIPTNSGVPFIGWVFRNHGHKNIGFEIQITVTPAQAGYWF